MIKDVAYVMRGRVRTNILKSLEHAKTPQKIAKEIDTHLSTTSRAMKDLSEKGFVRCLNPEDSFYRLYEITEKGKEILKIIKTIE